jgi:hypothetical protein
LSEPRLPEDTAIETARAERNALRRAAERAIRAFTNELIENIEADILQSASLAGATNPDEYLDYVERLIAARVVERTLTP